MMGQQVQRQNNNLLNQQLLTKSLGEEKKEFENSGDTEALTMSHETPGKNKWFSHKIENR